MGKSHASRISKPRKTLSPEDEFPASAHFLMCKGFPIVLLNIITGLLPVTISGSKIRHSFCSVSTLFTGGSALAVVFLSVIFTPISIFMFLKTQSQGETSITDIMAIGILKASHIAGYLVLLLHSHRAARRLPAIWKDLVRVFQLSVIGVYGNNWPKLRKLTRFNRYTLAVFLFVIFVYQFVQSQLVMNDMLALFTETAAPIPDKYFGFLVAAGYVLWEVAALCHVVVSIFLTFIVHVVTLCLKSVNQQLKELVDSGRGDQPEAGNFWYEGGATAETTSERLDLFKRTYGLCEDITGSLSKYWGVALIVEAFILIGNTLANLFFIISGFMNYGMAYGSANYMNMQVIVSSVIHFYFIFQLSCVVTKMVAESKKPLRILKEYSYQRDSIYTRSKIASFKLDVAESNINLTAHSYFQVNKFMITSLIGCLTTYLVVLIQFKQQELVNNGRPDACDPCACLNGTATDGPN